MNGRKKIVMIWRGGNKNKKNKDEENTRVNTVK